MFNVNFVAQITCFVVVPSGHITDNCLHPHFLVWWTWMQQFTNWLVFLTASKLLLCVYTFMVCSQSLKLHCYLSKELSLGRK